MLRAFLITMTMLLVGCEFFQPPTGAKVSVSCEQKGGDSSAGVRCGDEGPGPVVPE